MGVRAGSDELREYLVRQDPRLPQRVGARQEADRRPHSQAFQFAQFLHPVSPNPLADGRLPPWQPARARSISSVVVNAAPGSAGGEMPCRGRLVILSYRGTNVPVMSDGIRVGGSPLEGSPAWGVAAGERQLFGRAGEIEALLAVLGGLRTAGGRAIALVGEPGIGKSALMRTAVAHARAAGVRVDAAQGQYAIAPALPGRRPLLDEPCDVREQVARGGAAVVAVDDLHHLAADQIPGLERMLHATATGPLLCLLAYRQHQLSPALAAVLSRAMSAGLLEVWQLGPLSRAATRELLGDRPDLAELHREGRGNPQYLKIMAADGPAIAVAGTSDPR